MNKDIKDAAFRAMMSGENNIPNEMLIDTMAMRVVEILDKHLSDDIDQYTLALLEFSMILLSMRGLPGAATMIFAALKEGTKE